MPDRLELDTYLPRHPAYISLLEPSQQQIAKAEDTLQGIYIIEIIHRFSPSSIMIPTSHPPSLGPWPSAPPSIARRQASGDSGRIQGTGVIPTRPSVDFD